MNNIEILLDEKKTVKIADRTYEIGALGFNQLKKLGRWLAEIGKNFEGMKWRESNVGDILIMLEKTDDKVAAELFSILLKEKDTGFILNHVLSSIKVMQRVLEIVFEMNDFKKVFENFIKATGINLAQVTQKIQSQSRKSPQQ